MLRWYLAIFSGGWCNNLLWVGLYKKTCFLFAIVWTWLLTTISLILKAKHTRKITEYFSFTNTQELICVSNHIYLQAVLWVFGWGCLLLVSSIVYFKHIIIRVLNFVTNFIGWTKFCVNATTFINYFIFLIIYSLILNF